MDGKKIDLTVSGSEIFVWKADDWLILRQTHRILGDCIGCIAKKPRQENISGLPLLLLPEEAKLLVEKDIGRLVQKPMLKEIPTESLKKKFEEYRNKLFLDQQDILIEKRKLQLSSVMDRIVEGKKRKLLGLDTSKKKVKKPLDDETRKALDEIEIDKEALMEEEVAKLPKIKKSDAFVQIHTAYPWNTGDIKIEMSIFPSTDEEVLKYKVFKDMWEKGYYITSGQKFGCDYLAYPGDPIMFHSQLLIYCKNRNDEISIPELIAESRIGSHVRKTLVFATLSNDGGSIEYFSSRWADSSMGYL
ncbi:tRNA-splicing endonuclease subunit Sen34 [Copidosoma floridanum]|uniref:tRNA-splicing endonuclease subunit Sen34 n=1 Tax=Copidosoma floridanum TaxID=29053 RepID=UPI0006C96183|nr:tRNA-splicing endonuclease subunit Sen34 [Copidosoma floridanum]